MLVLTRKKGEKIVLGGNIVLTILSVDRTSIRLGIEAPPPINIVREELSSRSSLPFPSVERTQDA